MNLTDAVNDLNDEDLITLLKVLTCPAGQEQEIYFNNRAAQRLGKTHQGLEGLETKPETAGHAEIHKECDEYRIANGQEPVSWKEGQ